MSDKTRDDNNFQKRKVCVFVAPLAEVDILTTGSVYGKLPDNSVVISASILVTTVSGTASSTLDIKVGSTVVANEVAVTAAGMIAGTMVAANQYFATGGDITVLAGAVAPAAGDFIGYVIIEYIELDLHTGDYTEMTNS